MDVVSAAAPRQGLGVHQGKALAQPGTVTRNGRAP